MFNNSSVTVQSVNLFLSLKLFYSVHLLCCWSKETNDPEADANIGTSFKDFIAKLLICSGWMWRSESRWVMTKGEYSEQVVWLMSWQAGM